VRAYKAKQHLAKERSLSKKLGLSQPPTESNGNISLQNANKSSDGDEIELIQTADQHRPSPLQTSKFSEMASKTKNASRRRVTLPPTRVEPAHKKPRQPDHHQQLTHHTRNIETQGKALSSEASAVANIFASMKKRVVVVADANHAEEHDPTEAEEDQAGDSPSPHHSTNLANSRACHASRKSRGIKDEPLVLSRSAKLNGKSPYSSGSDTKLKVKETVVEATRSRSARKSSPVLQQQHHSASASKKPLNPVKPSASKENQTLEAEVRAVETNKQLPGEVNNELKRSIQTRGSKRLPSRYRD
jgi:hypothetical protein